jgi:hypothetical protein
MYRQVAYVCNACFLGFALDFLMILRMSELEATRRSGFVEPDDLAGTARPLYSALVFLMKVG